MRLLRYMVHIWEDYEKEMEREYPGILKDTPEHLLEILAKVFRTLLYSMNLPEDEVEDAVAKIKERKMGRLFENVTMDIQEERRIAREARKEAEEAWKGMEEARKTAEKAWRDAEKARKVAEEAQQELNNTQAALAEKDAYIAALERKLAAVPKSE